MEIMLCGAHDAEAIEPMFKSVVASFGATPWFYRDGTIMHINSATSSWAENSRATVAMADVCVFVILENYGSITWNEELDEALALGKPFVVLALEKTWVRYNTLLDAISDSELIKDKNDQLMIDVLRKMSINEFTVVTFGYDTFADKLRGNLSHIFGFGIKVLTLRNQRATMLASLSKSGKLTERQIEQLISLATDELEENKLSRKTAIKRLALENLRDEDFLLDICRSDEQGVQRLGFSILPSLVPLPMKDDLLRELAQIANNNDDVGTQRRFVNSVTELCPENLDIVLESVEALEVGIRRRAYEGVEQNWSKVMAIWGNDRMKRFLDVCHGKSAVGASWQERLRKKIDSLNVIPPMD
ncbi:hypothetical protein KBW81_07340 [Loktanella salsilacus]|uniref:hypothetical protein n=1 Tax=Loktanella salsilacus TaxID=195913 RepID=UPI0020B780CB|nr:hypothetical protein [Loktanella salsilacus]UTH49557.1 hypothetical protein KBW81_07340 [Loktanella salsilacus]